MATNGKVMAGNWNGIVASLTSRETCKLVRDLVLWPGSKGTLPDLACGGA